MIAQWPENGPIRAVLLVLFPLTLILPLHAPVPWRLLPRRLHGVFLSFPTVQRNLA
jgi:hypothetical protein